MRSVFGGIEGGGTKFNLLVGTGPDDIVDEARVPTTMPQETLAAVFQFFERPRPDTELAAIGVASFGPVDLNRDSPTYGHITTTPKTAWQFTDVVGALHGRFNLPIGWDTDVNGAALGEHRWGAGQGVDPLVYVTVGTGIGGGAVVNGRPLHGLVHPEIGHLVMPVVDGDTFPGVCPYHGRCLEGLTSGPALKERLGHSAEGLSPDDPVWELEAQYLAIAFLDITYVLSPRRIVVGGGVAAAPGLLDRVRRSFVERNNGYLASPTLSTEIDSYLVAPALGSRSGAVGALELARIAHRQAG